MAQQQEDDVSKFLDKLLLGADGSSRKASPSPLILSPTVPVTNPPSLNSSTPSGTSSGETIMKRFTKSRHGKAASQQFRLDANQRAALKNEYDQQEQIRAPSEDLHLDHSLASNASLTEEEKVERPTLTRAFTKRFPKMSLPRSISGQDKQQQQPQQQNPNGTARPRSPSKDTSGGLMRLGNRSAIGSKLGFGKRSIESEELETATPSLSIPISSSQHPPPLPHSGLLDSPALQGMSAFRRSSAPNFEGVLQNPLASPAPSNLSVLSISLNQKESSEEDKILKGRSSDEEPGPMFLQEKNNSSSSQALPDNNLSGSSQMVTTMESRQEANNVWRKEHEVLEGRMARTEKGARTIASIVVNSVQKAETEKRGLKLFPDETMRVAALTLQQANNRRLQELEIKMEKYEARCVQVANYAKQVREELVSECKKVLENVNSIERNLDTELQSFRKRETTFKTNMTKNENEIKVISEKVNEALISKEKNFNILMSDAESKLKTLTMFHGTSSGWLDAVFHSISEFVLLGGGTLLSIISFIFVFIKGLIPCLRKKKRRVSSKPRVMSDNSNGGSTRSNNSSGGGIFSPNHQQVRNKT